MAHNFVLPQLALRTQELPNGDGWVFQEKIDGHRAIISLRDGKVLIYSRNGHDRTSLFASLAAELKSMALPDCVLDGEVCAEDRHGRSDFNKLGTAISAGGPFAFRAFDLLRLENSPLLEEPISVRLGHLGQVLGNAIPAVSAVAAVTDGTGLLDTVRARHGEGIIAKRLTAPYRPGERHSDWLKLKLTRRQEFIVAGWHEDAEGTMQSLVLASAGPGGLIFRGCVGTGFSNRQRRDLRLAMASAATPRAPFIRAGGIRRNVRWTDPRLIVEIEYGEITSKGSVRHPRFVGLREDKAPGDVVLDLA